MSSSQLQSRLLAWYRAVRRDLPWRRTSDPYAILLSESMLQQTRVEAAIPYYRRFLERWPTLPDLAAAAEDEVLRAWAGLGYYARARNLHGAVKACVERHEGRLPSDPEALRLLPGIGPYTAGAVLSIAFGAAAPAVDGNVVRVLSRLFAIESQDPRPDVERLAASLVPREAPGDWNQALMEMGATVCIPKAPRCDTCPVADLCRGRERGIAALLPKRPEKRAPKAVTVLVALLRRPRDGAVLLVKRPAKGILAGMWAPPSLEKPASRKRAARLLEEAFPWLEARAAGASWVHKLTHRTWTCEGWECVLREGAELPEGSRFALPEQWGEVPTAFRMGLSIDE